MTIENARERLGETREEWKLDVAEFARGRGRKRRRRRGRRRRKGSKRDVGRLGM